MKKEVVLNILSELGFIPEKLEEAGYQIEYEWLKIVFIGDEDESCVTFIVPQTYIITDENRTAVYSAIVQLNGMLRYAQAYVMNDNQVWISYIHYLADTIPSADLIEHMITAVSFATAKFHEIINSHENNR